MAKNHVVSLQVQPPRFGAATRTRRTLCTCHSHESRFDLRSGLVPDRLVRGIVTDTDTDHPRHPHQQDSVPAEPRELAADPDLGRDHAGRGMAACFADRTMARVRPAARALLATIAGHARTLRSPDTIGEDVSRS